MKLTVLVMMSVAAGLLLLGGTVDTLTRRPGALVFSAFGLAVFLVVLATALAMIGDLPT